jgi:hypothetical protein
MPIYEFYCDRCALIEEQIRLKVGDTKGYPCFFCGETMFNVASVPAMHVWNQDRRFPNLTGHGDGSMRFGSKFEYKKYLKENHVGESAHDAPKKTKPCTKVITYGTS